MGSRRGWGRGGIEESNTNGRVENPLFLSPVLFVAVTFVQQPRRQPWGPLPGEPVCHRPAIARLLAFTGAGVEGDRGRPRLGPCPPWQLRWGVETRWRAPNRTLTEPQRKWAPKMGSLPNKDCCNPSNIEGWGEGEGPGTTIVMRIAPLGFPSAPSCLEEDSCFETVFDCKSSLRFISLGSRIPFWFPCATLFYCPPNPVYRDRGVSSLPSQIFFSASAKLRTSEIPGCLF